MTHPREPYPTPPGAARTAAPPGRTALTGTPPGYGQPAPSSQPRGGPSAGRLTLAPLIRSALDSAAERRQQRRRLVSTLILAQLLLTLAVSVGYFGSQAAIPVLIAFVAALVIYLGAFIVNSFLHHATAATYILIVGGGAAVTGQVFATALTGNPLDTAQVALFFLAIVLEAGLLLAPEVTLLVAGITTTLTAVALLLALALGAAVTRRDAYLVVVYTLSLQSLVGIISWLLAHFVSESVSESQRAQELQFAQARLDTLRRQMNDQRRQLWTSVAAIQSAITRTFGGSHAARAEVPDGELSDLAQSINELLRRIEAAARAEQEIERRDAATGPIMDQIARMAEPGLPGAPSLPLMTNTPMDDLSIAASHSQANIAHRLSRVQALVSQIAGELGHSTEGLATASEEVMEAKRLAGLLVAMADSILTATQKQLDLIARTRRVLGGLLPDDLAQLPPEVLSGLSPEEAAMYRGLGLDLGLGTSGTTSQFPVTEPGSGMGGTRPLPERDGLGGTRPLPERDNEGGTRPLPERDNEGGTRPLPERAREPMHASGAHAAPPTGDIPPEVLDAWGLLARIAEEVGQEERSISGLTHEVGLLAAVVRRVDTGVAWAVHALETLRQDAERLQQLAGPPMPPPEIGGQRPANPSRPNAGANGPRIPQLARPLSDSGGLGDERGPAVAPGEPSQGPGSLRASDLINLDDLPNPEAGL